MAHEITSSSRTFDVQIDENVDFSSLMLSSNVLNGLKKNGFKRPSPVQLKAIPLGKCGVDLIVQAKSGTGKTCVFTVVALEMISTIGGIQAVILAPTREIAVQVKEVIDMIGCCMPGLQCHAFIGGIPMEQDIQKLSNCQIAVGTPGRIKYLIESKKLRTESVRLFVVDEADKLLEPGSFQEQINWIYSTLPSNKQVLALSATYPEYLASHLSNYMNDPLHVRINSDIPTLLGIEQYYDVVPGHHLPHIVFERKADRLASFLAQTSFQQCLVFSNYQTRAEYLAEKLSKKGWPVTFIAGKQSQEVRLSAMKQLKEFHCRVLISTDLMSRGIDCDKIDLVINLDLPWDTETYLHRIGRAGRFGNYGMALSLVTPGSEMKKLQGIATEIKHEIKSLTGGECELAIISKTNGVKESPNDDLLLVSKESYDDDHSTPSAKPNGTDSLTLTNPIDACSNDSTLEISHDETDFVICHDRTDGKLSANPDALPQGSKQENAKNVIIEPAGNMEADERNKNSNEDVHLPSVDEFESLLNSFVSNELLNSNIHDVEICKLPEEDHQGASLDECKLSDLKRCLLEEDQLNEQVSDKSLVLDRTSVMSCRPAESDATVGCHQDDSKASPVDELRQRSQSENCQHEGSSAAHPRLPKTGNNNEEENVSEHEPFLEDMPKDFATTDILCQSGHRMVNPVKVIDRNIDSSAILKAFGMFINWDLVQSVANQLNEDYEQDSYNEDFAKTSDKHVKAPLVDQDGSLKKQLDDGDTGLCKRVVKSETAPFAEAVVINQLSDDLKKQDRNNLFVEEDHSSLNKQLNNCGLVESDVNSYKPLISKQDIDNQLSGEEDLKKQDRKNLFVEEDHSSLNKHLNNCGLVESDVNSYKPLISKQDIDNQLSDEEDLTEKALYKEDVNACEDDLGMEDVNALFKVDDFDFVEAANPNSAKLNCVLYEQTELCPNNESSETNSTTDEAGSSHDEEILTQECLRERDVNLSDEETNGICRSKLPASLDFQTDRSKWEYFDKSINDVGSNIALLRSVNKNHEHENDLGETEKLQSLSKRNISKKNKQTRSRATNCNFADDQRGSKEIRYSTRQSKQPLKKPTAGKRDSELCQRRQCSCTCHALSSSKHTKFFQALHQAYEEQTNWLRFHSRSHAYFRKRDNWLWWQSQ